MAAAETWACERGYAKIASDAPTDNLLSARAHPALGFAEVGRQVHFRKDLQVAKAPPTVQPSTQRKST